jgi:hypothetical protein
MDDTLSSVLGFGNGVANIWGTYVNNQTQLQNAQNQADAIALQQSATTKFAKYALLGIIALGVVIFWDELERVWKNA